MSKLTLFLPHSMGPDDPARDGADVQRVTLSAQQISGWLTAADLARHCGDLEHVAVTCNTDETEVREMVSQLRDLRADADAVIVFPCNSVPSEISARIPESLHVLLRIPQPADLFFLRADIVKRADSRSTLLRMALDQKAICLAGHRSPNATRFPVPGPGASPQHDTGFQHWIHARVAEMELSSMERKCVECGLLLLWDFLDESHAISQTMEGKGTPRTADYWHGIMHRREPDAGNAAYWFRRVGSHPAFEQLGRHLLTWMKTLGASDQQIEFADRRLLKQAVFNPMAMIELSTVAIRSPRNDEASVFRLVQYLEMLNLLAWSFGMPSR